MKKLLYIFVIVLFAICIGGCNKEENKVSSENKLVAAKEMMTKKLDNYSYDIKITTKTGFMGVAAILSCQDDRKNEIGYCLISSYGFESEQYIDYKNKAFYSKLKFNFGGDSSSNRWITAKYNGGDSNAWVNLNDYIFDIKEESGDGGTYYNGTIDSEKLIFALSLVDSDFKESNNENGDVDIKVFVNSSNYIEKMYFTLKVLDVETEVEISYKRFNTSGDLVIPAEITKN